MRRAESGMSHDANPPRAWITPDGHVHNVPWFHTAWVGQNPDKVPEAIRYPDNSLAVLDTEQAMFRAGWIRKGGPGAYQVHDDHREKVMAHLKTHGEHGAKVGILGSNRGDSNGVFVYDAKNHELRTWDTSRYDGGADRHAPKVKYEQADRLLRSVLGEDHEVHFDDYHRAWLSPRGVVHEVGVDSPLETHYQWVRRNGDKIPDQLKGPTAGATHNNMIQAGWVKKHASDMYTGTRDSVSTVHKHFTSYHPWHSQVGLEIHGEDTGPRDAYGVSLSMPQVTDSGELKESSSLENMDDFRNPSQRGWITPEGKLHKLSASPDNFDTHMRWVRDHMHRPDVIPSHLHGGSTDTHTAWTSMENMLKSGWVRKAHARSYEVSDTKHIDTVKAHVKEHHPEVKSVDVWVQALGRRHSVKMNESYNFPTSHRGWIDPDNSYYKIGALMTHGGWIAEHRSAQFSGSDPIFAPIEAGWIRKENKNQYHMNDLNRLPDVMRHVRENHDELKTVRVVTAEKGDAAYHLPVADPSHYEGATHQSLSQHRRAYSWEYDERRLMPESDNWMDTRDAAWISPEGKVHDLNGQVHADWIKQNHKENVPEEQKTRYSDGDVDTLGTQRKMIASGWIRKQDSGLYHAHTDHIDRALEHMRKHHPERKNIAVYPHGSDGPVGRMRFMRADGKSLDDSRAGTVTSRVLSENDWVNNRDGRIIRADWLQPDGRKVVESEADELIKAGLAEAWRGGTLAQWMAKRHAGWIDPQGGYYKLEPSEHHREWTQHPRNGRALRNVHNAMDPYLHEDPKAVQNEMLKQGWIRKLDHDQYIVGKHADLDKAIEHFDRHHPNKRRMEVGVENYPARGQLKRFYFHRDPDTQGMTLRKKWREKRSAVGTSERHRRWRSTDGD